MFFPRGPRVLQWLLCPVQDDATATRRQLSSRFLSTTTSGNPADEVRRVCRENELVIEESEDPGHRSPGPRCGNRRTAHAPGQAWKHGRTTVKTLWGELAWQLGGGDGFALLRTLQRVKVPW